jgi:hypothetical protein
LKLPVFLHVDDSMPLETEQPCQGSLPDLKLVWQPPAQLFVACSSLASFTDIDSGAAGGVGVIDDVGSETVRRVTTRGAGLCDLATCLGASTTTSGSEPAEGVAACDAAMPHRSGAAEKIAAARKATKRDENLIAMPFLYAGYPIPSRTGGYHIPERPASAN